MLLLSMAVPIFSLFVPEFDSPTSLLFGNLRLILSQHVHLKVPPVLYLSVLFVSILNTAAAAAD